MVHFSCRRRGNKGDFSRQFKALLCIALCVNMFMSVYSTPVSKPPDNTLENGGDPKTSPGQGHDIKETAEDVNTGNQVQQTVNNEGNKVNLQSFNPFIPCTPLAQWEGV